MKRQRSAPHFAPEKLSIWESNVMRFFSKGISYGFDGPGTRLVFYTRGCNFRCRWCANPEGLENEPRLLFYPDRSPFTDEACPMGAVIKARNSASSLSLDKTVCGICSERPCVNVWKHPSFELAGFEMDPEMIVCESRKHRAFFGGSGGVTFGGGEPTIQHDGLIESLSLLKLAGIDTAVETNASAPLFGELLNFADKVICDLKCVSRSKHIEWTYADNSQTLKNIESAILYKNNVTLRVTLVPGFNDDVSELLEISRFIHPLAEKRVAGSGMPLTIELLKVHHLGESKYRALGASYPMKGNELVSETAFKEALKLLSSKGILIKPQV